MQLRLLNVAVDGGDMRVLLWGTGKRVAVAVHGITASGMSWQAVARHMPPDWTLAAPDLRGRGHSRDLPGPFGLDRHARDVVAVLRHFGGRPVLAGHSMGAYVALLARDAHPELVRRLVLVDGGLPLPVPDGTDLDAVLDATLGPAIARLGRTFPSTEAYLDFWRAHPALAAHWSPDVEAYARYDLTGEPGQLKARAAEDAVRADGRDMLTGKPFAAADRAGRDARRAAAADPARRRPDVAGASPGPAAAGRPRDEPLHDPVRPGGRGGRVPGHQGGRALNRVGA